MDTARQVRVAALSLFSQRGYEGTSVRDICAAAGVSSNALHYHFGSKQALYAQVLSDFGPERLDTPQRIVSEGPHDAGELRTRLSLFIEESIAALLPATAQLRLLHQELESVTPRAPEAALATLVEHARVLEAFIDAARARSLVRSDVDPWLAADLLVERIVTEVRQARANQTRRGVSIADATFRRHWIAQTLELVLHGVRT